MFTQKFIKIFHSVQEIGPFHFFQNLAFGKASTDDVILQFLGLDLFNIKLTSKFYQNIPNGLGVIISKHQNIAKMAENDMSQIFLKLCVYFPYVQWWIKVDAFLQSACPFPWQPRFSIFSLIWRFSQWKTLELTPSVLTKILKKVNKLIFYISTNQVLSTDKQTFLHVFTTKQPVTRASTYYGIFCWIWKKCHFWGHFNRKRSNRFFWFSWRSENNNYILTYQKIGNGIFFQLKILFFEVDHCHENLKILSEWKIGAKRQKLVHFWHKMNQNANKNILQSKQKLRIHPSHSKLCLTLNIRGAITQPTYSK